MSGVGLSTRKICRLKCARAAHDPSVHLEAWRAEREVPTVTWTASEQPSADRCEAAGSICGGDDFWTVVYQPFKAHELGRRQISSISIDAGLRKAGGSYRRSADRKFNLPATRTSGFTRFCMYQHNCNLPVGGYRKVLAGRWLCGLHRRQTAAAS